MNADEIADKVREIEPADIAEAPRPARADGTIGKRCRRNPRHQRQRPEDVPLEAVRCEDWVMCCHERHYRAA